MKTCLQTFNTGVDELIAFLNTTEHESELIKLLLQHLATLQESENKLLNKIASTGTERKRYIYTVAIISLYGLLERCIDTLIEAFINRIASLVCSYKLMPDAIKKNHIPLSIELIKAIVEERHRECKTQEEIIANLHSCLSSAADFHINSSAFVLHRGNITLKRITNYLTSIGIDAHLRRLILTPEFLKYFNEKYPERDIRQVADQDLSGIIGQVDDLVERRNQVAHGVINIDDIESIDLMKERCRFVAAYGNALYSIMRQDVLKYQIKHTDVQSLGRPIAVYNKTTVCFESSNCKIAVGDIIVASTNNDMEPIRDSPIVSLQIDHKDYEEIVITQPIKFGVKVSFKAVADYDYYVIPAEEL